MRWKNKMVTSVEEKRKLIDTSNVGRRVKDKMGEEWKERTKVTFKTDLEGKGGRRVERKRGR